MSFDILDNAVYIDNKKIKEIEENYLNDYTNYMIELKNDEELYKVLNLYGKDLKEDILFYYQTDEEIYEIYILDKVGFLRKCVLINLGEWMYLFSPNDFIEYVKNENYGIEDSFIGDETLFIQYNFEFQLDSKILDVDSIISQMTNEIFKNMSISKNISKSINFSPEHFTAGISILQYFGKLLQEKYPNEKVSVSIKQEGLKVIMLIETPDGKKEEIEEYLNKFGMVVTNQMRVNEFASNPIQQLELETKLKAAEMEIGFQKKLLALQDKTYDENLVSLKEEIKFLREELSSLRIGNNENIQLLLSSLKLKDKMIKDLTKAIVNKNIEETKILLLELKSKDKNGYKSLKEYMDSFVVGSFTNAP